MIMIVSVAKQYLGVCEWSARVGARCRPDISIIKTETKTTHPPIQGMYLIDN